MSTFNVEILLDAGERLKAAEAEAKADGYKSRKILENVVFWQDMVRQRADWLKLRALEHAVEFLGRE